MSAWKDVIDAHMAFLVDVDGDHDDAGNAVRERDSLTFTFERNSQPHEIMDADGGAYSQAGTLLSGSVDPAEIILGVADVVTIEGVRWRVVAVSDVRIGAELISQDVTLAALEG
ncbi:MAG: hypothetical protein Q8R92_21065 [Deltaproteobacteria bacterium]|nr:hypothetical protein [Deltaproteobacteria bacterium]